MPTSKAQGLEQEPKNLDFDVVAFAGGGNRCYWQGGFWEVLTAVRPQNPRQIVAASAGAFQACVAVLGLGPKMREIAYETCAQKPSAFDWRRLAQKHSPLIVGDLFRGLITMLFGPEEIAALKKAPEILIQLSHPPKGVPAALAAAGAIAAYQIEKLTTKAVHSKAGGYIGLTPSWVSTHETQTPSALADALIATCCVPPFMPLLRIDGRGALDGGLVDNPPLQKLRAAEDSGARTLVLATRDRAPGGPSNRTVVGPSRPIRVGKFSVDDAQGLEAAYALGRSDAERFLDRVLK